MSNRNDMLDYLNELKVVEKELIDNPNDQNLSKRMFSLKQKIDRVNR